MREEMGTASYLIIAGVVKAGTTSLFNYLQDHPQICASSVKETRFFLEANHPLPAKYRLADGLEKYETFFKHCPDKNLRLEATPHYLYSDHARKNIKTSLANVKLVFSLRDPIDRLISLYRFAQQNNTLSHTLSFEEYVRLQLEPNAVNNQVPTFMLHALERGRYSSYLEPYIKDYGREAICIVRSESLKQNPRLPLTKICQFAEIDPSLYEDYTFKVFHKTQTVKNPALHSAYLKLRRFILMQIHTHPKLITAVRQVQSQVESFYFRLNRRIDEAPIISESLMHILEDYYHDEYKALAQYTSGNLNV